MRKRAIQALYFSAGFGDYLVPLVNPFFRQTGSKRQCKEPWVKQIASCHGISHLQASRLS